MAKVTAQDLRDMGFIPEMFKKADNAFDAFLTIVIAEQSAILQDRVGALSYALTSSPVAEYVKRAEKCLCAAELIRRRITIILGNVSGSGFPISTSGEDRQMKNYQAEADVWIAKVVLGATTDSNDFVSGTLVTDHFTQVNIRFM